jgi:hypothetical protein
MRTTEEIREMVKEMTSDECYEFVSEIVRYRKVVLYGNWYSKKNIQDIVENIEPGYIRDRKITELLGEGTQSHFDFDQFYHELGDHSDACFDRPDAEFKDYIITDFLYFFMAKL